MSKRILLAVAAFAAVLLAGCTASDGDDAEVVEMQGTQFMPSDLTIEAGTKVIWHNTDSQIHNVVAQDEGADWAMESGELLESGDRYEYTFDEPGTYAYRCEPHSSMQDGECNGMCATVTVEAAAEDGADEAE